MEWIKLYTRKWLWGSGRTMTPEKRGVWIDLLSLAAEAKLRDGTLRLDVGEPMPRAWIATTLMLEPETLNACIVAFKADLNADDGLPRITEWEDGTIQITNWERFQGKPVKLIAKEVAIEQAQANKRRNKTATDALLRAVNRLNLGMEVNRYELTEDGKILDKKTGEVKEAV